MKITPITSSHPGLRLLYDFLIKCFCEKQGKVAGSEKRFAREMYWKKLDGELSPYLAAFCFSSKKRLIDWWLSLVNRIARMVHAMATYYGFVLFSNLSFLGTIQSLNPSSDYLEVTSVNHQIKLIKSDFFALACLLLLFRIVRKVSCSETHINDNTTARVSFFGKCVFDMESLRFHVLPTTSRVEHKKLWMEMYFFMHDCAVEYS